MRSVLDGAAPPRDGWRRSTRPDASEAAQGVERGLLQRPFLPEEDHAAPVAATLSEQRFLHIAHVFGIARQPRSVLTRHDPGTLAGALAAAGLRLRRTAG